MSALKSLCSSVVEHFLGKEEVGSPILLKGSTRVFWHYSKNQAYYKVFFEKVLKKENYLNKQKQN
jgi:hypothetical protein